MRLLLIYIWLTSALILFGFTVVIWSFSILFPKKKTTPLVYGVGILTVATASYFIGQGDPQKRALILFLGIILSYPHLSYRPQALIQPSLFINLIKNFGRSLIVLFNTVALTLFAIDITPRIHFLSYIGVFIIFIGSFGLWLTLKKKCNFERNPLNKKRNCQEGFWKKSRNPDYFFKIINAFGLLALSYPTPYGTLALIPFIGGSLSIFILAIPKREKELVLRLGNEYLLYKRNTNRLIPK